MSLNIKEIVRERAVTLSSIAKKMGMHRANMSAIASGARGVSLKVLDKMSHILDVSLDELIASKEKKPLFKNAGLDAVLDEIEKRNYDGIDKSWVDRVMIARNLHYKRAQKRRWPG